MISMEQFKELQDYNHKIISQCTDLENDAFKALSEGDFNRFNELIAQIDNLQKSLKSYH